MFGHPVLSLQRIFLFFWQGYIGLSILNSSQNYFAAKVFLLQTPKCLLPWHDSSFDFLLKSINEIHKPSYFDKTSLGQQADAALQQVLVLLLSVRSIALTRILDSATQKDLLKGIMTSLFFLPRILFAQGRLKNGKATHKKTSRALEKRSERTEIGTLISKASNFTFSPLVLEKQHKSDF